MSFKDYLNVYEFTCELPGTEEIIKYKPIVTSQMKKLLMHEKETDPEVIEEAFDELISSSITSENFNIENLFLQDRHFLLIELRKNSKGELYNFQFNCPECGQQNLCSINFSNLKVKKREKNVDKAISISDNVTIYVDHVTRGEQKEIYKKLKKENYKDPEEIEIMLAFNTLTQSIKSVETPEGLEELDYENKEFIVDNMTRRTLDKLREWHENNNFGIDFTFSAHCSQCDYKIENEEIPFNSNFF